MKLVFRKTGLTDLEIIGGRSFPITENFQFNQERYLTEDMKPKVIRFAGETQIIRVKISGLTRENVDGTSQGLVKWFQNSSIDGAKNSFTMIDEHGESHTVRLWSDRLNIRETGWNTFEISFDLLKEG